MKANIGLKTVTKDLRIRTIPMASVVKLTKPLEVIEVLDCINDQDFKVVSTVESINELTKMGYDSNYYIK